MMMLYSVLSTVATVAAVSQAGDADKPGRSAMRARGAATFLGTNGRFTLQLGPAGIFCYEAMTELPESVSWDGERARGMGVTGVSRTLHDHERVLALIEWWVLSGFWRTDGFPGAVLPDVRVSEGTAYQVSLDRVTARVVVGEAGNPLSVERRGAPGIALTRFADYRPVAGRSLPWSITTSLGGQEVRRLRVENVEWVDELGRCAADGSGPPAAFDPVAAPDVPVRRAPTGHFLVRPRIQGQDVGWFILDTGGGPGVVADEIATQLGLPSVGVGPVTSFTGTQSGTWYRAAEFALGPVRLEDVPLVGMDLGFLEKPLGARIAGIVGYGLLSRVVAEIVVATSTFRIHEPATYRTAGGGWQPLKLVDLVPVVHGAFPGGVGDFRLDLGAGGPAGGVVFHSPAVERLDLARVPSTGPRAADATGGREPVAGVSAIPTRLEWFELGGQRLEDVPALLWIGEEGCLADPYLEGNIGLGLLKSFVLELDYSRSRYRLLPR